MTIMDRIKSLGINTRDLAKGTLNATRSNPRKAALIGTPALLALAAIGYGISEGVGAARNYMDDSGEIATNYEFNVRTGEQDPDLERVIIHGKEFYARRREAQEGELGFEFLPFEETSRVLDLDSNTSTLDSKTTFVPRRVRLLEGYTVDRWADRLDLGGSVTAKIPSQEDLRVKSGAPRNSQGFSGQDNVEYGLSTMRIFEERYFFPRVETSQTGRRDAVDFYLVPLDGAQVIIDNSDGGITLENINSVYRATVESIEEVFEQTDTAQVEKVGGR